MFKKISTSVIVAAILMSGCSENKEAEQASQVSNQASSHSEVSNNLYGTSSLQTNNTSSNRDVKAGASHIAKVLETMNAANYTYAKVEENGNIYWVAGPESQIAVGMKVSFIEQMVMEQFTSKSLGKTFDSIVFATTLIPADKMDSHSAKHNCDTCGDKKPVVMNSGMSASPHGATKKQVSNIGEIKVQKANNGYTVEELYTKKTNLKDKKIKVNAKVVKVSKNIMKKDWIHLQDGTGSGPTSDIVVTMVNSDVNVGDTLSVDATLKTDVDFGYGYFFSVILEGIKASKI